MGLMRRPGLVGSSISAWVCRYGLGFVDLGLGLGLLDDLGLGVGLCQSRRGGGAVGVIEGRDEEREKN